MRCSCLFRRFTGILSWYGHCDCIVVVDGIVGPSALALWLLYIYIGLAVPADIYTRHGMIARRRAGEAGGGGGCLEQELKTSGRLIDKGLYCVWITGRYSQPYVYIEQPQC